MEIGKQDKLKLIHFLNFVCDYEASKPIEEMDEELINACVKVLLELQDKHVKHSPEFIDEQVRKIFHKEETKITAPETVKTTKKVVSKKKIWLVAACIAILVALFSIVSFSSERSVVDVLEDFFGTYEFIPFGKEVDVGNESFGKASKKHIYNSVEEFIKTEKTDLLYPSNTIDTISHISIGKKDGIENIRMTFEDSDLFISIILNSEIPQETIDFCNKKITLNEIDYYLCIMEDINQVQAYFIHNNNLYVITHSDKNALVEIINNMEEINYDG